MPADHRRLYLIALVAFTLCCSAWADRDKRGRLLESWISSIAVSDAGEPLIANPRPRYGGEKFDGPSGTPLQVERVEGLGYTLGFDVVDDVTKKTKRRYLRYPLEKEEPLKVTVVEEAGQSSVNHRVFEGECFQSLGFPPSNSIR